MSAEKLSVEQVRALLAAERGARLRRLCEQFASDERAGVAAAVRSALAREAARDAERERLERLYGLEVELRAAGRMTIAGVDEVGRGALAGPLTAGACVLPDVPRIEGLDDSKRLTPQRREEVAIRIREVAVCWSVAHVPADEVDSLGVTAALRRAMGRALAGLQIAPDHVVVDGRPIGIARGETAVVKGDSKVAAIAAASVLAKVERDALMVSLDAEHPAYGFAINKGYGTPEHLDAIARHGVCALHRRSFVPGGGTDTLF